jgi:16S rRNA (adenine1518-N6/adenine1519-N6)-dimethyltransferase
MTKGRKSGGHWGQNFLVDLRLARRMAAAVAGHRVIEVGPGRGALTRPLLEACPRVVAVEIDPELAAALRAELGADPATSGRFVLVEGDAAETSWADLMDLALVGAGPEEPPVALAANLPYQAATPILLAWLEHAHRDPRQGDGLVMLQSEVAERLAAGPRTKAYGSLSVLVQATHEVATFADVGAGAFRPAPRVRSRVVRLTRRRRPLIARSAWSRQAAFVHRCFAQRRKQLAGVLAGLRGRTREQWQARLADLGHAPRARAEELSPADLLALAEDQGAD